MTKSDRKSLVDLEKVNRLGNINVDLLGRLATQGHPDAMRELARYIHKHTHDSELLAQAGVLLLIAARSADRGASWLLALYYRDGRYGFGRDVEKAEYWRKRTEDRLASDADLLYENPALAWQAKRRYELWLAQRRYIATNTNE